MAGFGFVLFDLDGTLCDTLDDIAASVNSALRSFGGPELAREVVRGFVGRGARVLIEQCVRGTTLQVDPVFTAFLREYDRNLTRRTRLYPGVAEGLSRLSDVGKAVASNKPEGMSIRLIRELGLSAHFLEVAGGDTFSRRKPDPLPLLEMMRRHSASAAQTLVVGDSEIDRDAARAAGVKVCGVRYGYGDRFDGFDYRVDDFEGVVGVIRGG
jgi:phosphoglycolate phosphatase